MIKWFDEKIDNNTSIISSRIRLARNLKKYPFSLTINNEQSLNMIKEVSETLINDTKSDSKHFLNFDFNKEDDLKILSLFERHTISNNFLHSKKNKGLIISNDEKISIMINEEDHIRLQTFLLGEQIEEALKLANNIDNQLDENIEYAFSKNFGYLTTCPTNVGTGLRASYMIHIPMLKMSPNLPLLINSVGKLGMTIRGIYGEGTEPSGNIYQISNQITIGKTEDEIISGLKTVTNQLIEHEKNILEQVLKYGKIGLSDRVNRAYGILASLRRVSLNEAMELLSDVKIGFNSGLIDMPKPEQNFYSIILSCRSASLQIASENILNEEQRDIKRADFLRTVFKL